LRLGTGAANCLIKRLREALWGFKQSRALDGIAGAVSVNSRGESFITAGSMSYVMLAPSSCALEKSTPRRSAPRK
jgi:hypothetical protein